MIKFALKGGDPSAAPPEATATQYPDANKGKISDTGQ